MRPVTAAIIGAIAGGLILIVISLTVYGVRNLRNEPDIHAADLTHEQGPIYEGALQVCQKLAATRVGCTLFPPTAQLINGEIEAAPAAIGGVTGRISLYPSREVVGNMLDRATGMNAYRQPIDVVAGENWTVTVLPNGDGHEVADAVKQELGGAVFTSEELARG